MDKKVFDPESIKPAWVAWVEILKRLEEQPYHWPVGRTRFQKIAYFAQHQGLPLSLSLKRMSCHSISTEFKNLMSHLLDNGLIREQRLGKMFAVKVGQTYQDAYKAYATYLIEEDRTKVKTAHQEGRSFCHIMGSFGKVGHLLL